MTNFPSQARVVIVGGGVIGCSVAYHLAKLGWKNIVLLERKQLTSGTTWHAAGLIGQLRATFNMTKLAIYSSDLYDGLEVETGVATGYKRNGSLSLAITSERMEELTRGAVMAKNFGIAADILSSEEVQARYPLLNTLDSVGGLFLPSDGQADPTNIALALAKGARQHGAEVYENVKVTGIKQANGYVHPVPRHNG